MGILIIAWLALVLVGMPLLSRRAVAAGAVRRTPRPALYRAGMTTSWSMSLSGLAVLWWEDDLDAADCGLAGLPVGSFLAWVALTLAALLAGAGLIRLMRSVNGSRESRELLHLLPRSRRDRRLWIGLSLSAGLNEEIVFRGITLAAVARLAGVQGGAGVWLVAAALALPFGLGHAYQDALGMARAGLLGFLLAVPVLVTGSLLPGMAAHALADLAVLTSRRLRR